MGLNFTWKDIKPDTPTAQWSYAGFYRFRQKIAETIDLRLDGMEEYTPYGRSWDTVKSPIKYLLNHSDCDGYIPSKKCKLVADELMRIISKWSQEDYDYQNGKLLAENMMECYKNHTPLQFT